MQKKHNIGSFELLSKTAPIQAASLVILGPFVDYALNNVNLLEYQMSWGAAVSTSSSSCFCLLVSELLEFPIILKV
jgi:hypothetical protein